MKNILKLASISLLTLSLLGCRDAQVVSQNLSEAADNFEIQRRTVFYNGISGDYILTIEGKCSLSTDGSDKKLVVICKTSDKEYKKHFLGLSDNVTYFSEQLESKSVSAYHYKVIFKPETILPDIDLKLE